MPKLTLPTSIFLGCVLISATVFFDRRSAPAQSTLIPPVTSVGDHILANKGGNIKVIEYSDPECPFCKSFHATMKKITEENKNVEWVYRQFPLPIHSLATKESEALECAGDQGKFKEYVDRLFEITPSNNKLDPKKLPEIAQYVGIDVSAFNSCLSSGKNTAKVNASIAEGKKVGINSTPYNFVVKQSGGWFSKTTITEIKGAQPIDKVRAALQ